MSSGWQRRDESLRENPDILDIKFVRMKHGNGAKSDEFRIKTLPIPVLLNRINIEMLKMNRNWKIVYEKVKQDWMRNRKMILKEQQSFQNPKIKDWRKRQS